MRAHRSIGRWHWTRQAAGLILVVVAAVILLAVIGGSVLPGARQADVAARGAQVMPFDLDQTTHVFERLDDGGLQSVVADDASNTEQIALIRSHLRDEAERFRRGDFGDPATIHGEAMPGIDALRAGAGRIEVRYTETPDGAQIRYATTDPALVAAIADWFAAQLGDHGSDATDHAP